MGDRAGRTFEAGGLIVTRNERDLARAAYAIWLEEGGSAKRTIQRRRPVNWPTGGPKPA